MNNCIIANVILGISTGIIGGLVAGLFVEKIIEYKNTKRWRLVQTQLVELLDSNVNGIITSIRAAVGIPPPNQLPFQHEKDVEKNFIDYFVNILNNFELLRTKIEYLDSDREKQLSYNLLQVNDSLLKLVSFFGSFEAANPWYVESIFELQGKISLARLSYMIFPELGDPKYKNDEKLKGWRMLFFNDIRELLSFALQVKKNRLIRDLIDTKE
jgi:hypothetical protein